MASACTVVMSPRHSAMRLPRSSAAFHTGSDSMGTTPPPEEDDADDESEYAMAAVARASSRPRAVEVRVSTVSMEFGAKWPSLCTR